MEIKQMHIFIAAAETLSFTEAAERCFTVQSAISQQIASLEKELGVQLFLREKRMLSLTPEGIVFYKEAQKILADLDHARFSVQSAANGYQETLRIGRQGDLLRNVFPGVLRKFHESEPEVRLDIKRGNTQELLDKLENGKIDCAISVFFPEHRLYQWVEYRLIQREPIRVMIASDHPLANRGTISISDLNSMPLVLLEGSDKKTHLASMAEEGYSELKHTYMDSQNSIEQMVAAGYGISMLAESACRIHPSLSYLNLKEPRTVDVVICWNKNRVTSSLKNFVELLSNPSVK